MIPSLDLISLLKQRTELREIPCSLDQFITQKDISQEQPSGSNAQGKVCEGVGATLSEALPRPTSTCSVLPSECRLHPG